MFKKESLFFKRGLLLAQWVEGIPTITVQEFETNDAWETLREQFMMQCDDLDKLLLESHIAEDRLNEGYVLDEPFEVEGDMATLEELLTKITSNKFYEVEEIKQVLMLPVFDRISALRTIENKKKDLESSGGDLRQLVQIALDEKSSVVVALAAWRALYSLGPSNFVHDEDLIERMRENLEVLIKGIDDAQRKNLLQKILSKQFILYRYQITTQALDEAINSIELVYAGSSYRLELKGITNQLNSYSEKMLIMYPNQISKDQLFNDSDELQPVIDEFNKLTIRIHSSKKIAGKLNSALSEIAAAKDGIGGYLNSVGKVDQGRAKKVAKNLENLLKRVEKEKMDRFNRNPRKSDEKIFDQLCSEFKTIENDLDLWKIIKEVRDEVLQTDSDFLNSEWRHWCSAKLDSLTSETVNNNKSKYYNEVRNLYKLKKFLEALSKNLELKKDLNEPIKSKNKYVEWIQEYKKTLLNETVRKFFFNEDELIPENFIVRYVSFRDKSDSLIVDFNKIENYLNAGYTLDEGREGSTIGSLWEKWQDQIDALPQFKDAVQEIVSRVSALIAADAVPGKTLVATKSKNPEILMTAWKKLSEDKDWPRNMAELKQDMEMRHRIDTLIQVPSFKDTNPKQANRYREELTSGGPKVWLRFVKRSGNHEEVDFAILNRKLFRVIDDELPDWALFNVFLFEFKNKNIDNVDSNVILGFRDQLVLSLNSLTDLANMPAIIDFKTRLNDLKTQNNEANIADLGPGTSHWDADIRDYPDKVIYSKTLNGKKRNLTFYFVNSVDTPEGAGAYICSSEMSLRLVASLITSQKLLENEDFAEFFPPYSPFDDWQGPKVWERNGNKMVPGSQWLWRSPQFGRGNLYPNELKVPDPSYDHPMQYISPVAALFIAKKLGCRFPTSEEWMTAYRDSKKQTLFNLRGEQFEKQKNYMLGFSLDKRSLPDEGIFLPSNMKTAENKSTIALESSNLPDPALWFVPVTSDAKKRFHHLVGNVAEYTMNFHNKTGHKGMIQVEDVRNILISAKEKLGVNGGSALSPPQLGMNRYPVDLTEAEYGYADVGFRLAFSASPATLASRWRVLLNAQKIFRPLKNK